MSLEIHIRTDNPDKTPVQQINEAMEALGFVRMRHTTPDLPQAYMRTETKQPAVVEPPYVAPDAEGRGCGSAPEPGPDSRGVMNVGLEHALAKLQTETVEFPEKELKVGVRPSELSGKRKPGEASPGHKRRTKAEMAEDEAHFARQVEAQAAANEFADQMEQGEIPIEPAPGEAELIAEYREQGGFEPDDAIAQDADDEAAEAAAERLAGGALTLEDLRREIGSYAKKHGIAKAQANVPAILGGPMLEVADFETTIARVKLATATSDGLLHEEAAQATIDDVREAVMAYAAKYEGKGVPPAPKGVTAVDLGEVMRKTFPGTSGALSEIPATRESYGKALAAVNEATRLNPFNREVK